MCKRFTFTLAGGLPRTPASAFKKPVRPGLAPDT